MINFKSNILSITKNSWLFFRLVRQTLIINVFGFYSGCKHRPSCSHYAFAQIKDKGLVVGGFWGLKRVFSCY